MKIEYDDLVFNEDQPRENATTWLVTGMEGWDTLDLRTSMVDPTSRHGSHLSRSLLGSRALTVKGVCKAPNEQAFWIAYNRLAALMNNLATVRPYVVHEQTLAKQLGVIPAGMPRREIVGVSAFTFEMPLTGLDPLKYTRTPINVTIGAGQTLTIDNPGTFISDRLGISVGAGRLSLQNLETGALLHSGTNSVLGGTSLNFYRRTAMAGAVNQYDRLNRTSQWWGLQPGANRIKNAGSTAASVAYYPAWL